MGLIGLVIMFAPAIGPTLSGIIVEYLGWRYLFITVIPFALFSIAFAYKYLVNVSEVTKPKIDVDLISFLYYWFWLYCLWLQCGWGKCKWIFKSQMC